MVTGGLTLLYLIGVGAAWLVRGRQVWRLRGRYTRAERLAMMRAAPGETALMLLWFLASQALPVAYLVTRLFDFADYGLPLPAQAALGGAGAVLFAGAIVLLRRAHADLGRAWSPVVEVRAEQELVTTGVYRRIRHPMYAAHLLWGVAQALLVHNWLAGALALPLMALIALHRIPREERALLAHFGDRYAAYRTRTGRLLPRWRGR